MNSEPRSGGAGEILGPHIDNHSKSLDALGGRLWEVETSEKDGHLSKTYRFTQSDLCMDVLNHKIGKILTVFRRGKDGFPKVPAIMQANGWAPKSKGNGRLVVDIIDPKNNDTVVSIYHNKSGIFYSIDDRHTSLPFIVLRQTEDFLELGQRSDWLYVLDHQKDILEKSSFSSPEEKQLVEKMIRLVNKHFDAEEGKGDED